MQFVLLLMLYFYPLTTEIVDVDVPNDTVTCQDFIGNKWNFKGIEDYEVGDTCSMIMYNNGTANVFDDVIVTTKYDGYWVRER